MMLSLSARRGCVASRPSVSRRPTVKVAAFKVTFDMPTAQRVVEVDADTSLLAAAEAAGLIIPNLCGSGACGVCASRITSGEVEHAAELMPSEQAAAGFVFLCSTFPRSDVTLKTHQEAAMHNATIASEQAAKAAKAAKAACGSSTR